MKKDLAHFSSYYRVWQNSRKILEGSTSFCDIYTGKWNRIFLGREKLLETQSFEERASFPVKKSFWPNLSGYLQHEKCPGTTYNGPQGFFKFSVQKIRSLHWDLRGR